MGGGVKSKRVSHAGNILELNRDEGRGKVLEEIYKRHLSQVP